MIIKQAYCNLDTCDQCRSKIKYTLDGRELFCAQLLMENMVEKLNTTRHNNRTCLSLSWVTPALWDRQDYDEE